MEGVIEFKKVSFAYPERKEHQVYRGLDIRIESGETVALVGPSGSGKSSAVQLIERFYDPHEGTITLDGKDLKSLNVKWLREQIGLVQQEPVLFAGSIEENIRMGKRGSTAEEAVAAAKMANAHSFIESFPDGYKTECGAGSSQLSGGQKQRIAIARAIIRDPSVLILDEATSALDATSERIVQEALDQLLAKKKRTTVIIAHRLSTIRNADKIVVLDGGRAVEVGTHDSLMAIDDGHYKTLVMLQSSGDSAREDGATMDKGEETARKKSSSNVKHSATFSSADEDSDEAAEETVPEEEKTKAVNMSKKWLWDLSRQERPQLIVGVIGACMVGTVFPVLGFLISQMLEVFFNDDPQEMQRLARMWGLLFFGVGIFNGLGGFMRRYGFAVVTERLAARVRAMTYARMARREIAYFDQPANSAASLSTRLATDCLAVKSLVGESMGMIISQITTLAVSLILAFTASWELSLVMMGLIPLIGLSFGMQMKFIQKAGGDAAGKLNHAGSIVSASVLQVRTVAAMGLEDHMFRHLVEAFEIPMVQSKKKGLVTGLAMGMAQCTILSGAGLAYYIGSLLFARDILSFQDIMQVILCIMFGAIGLGALAADAADKMTASIAAKRIKEFLDEAPADCATLHAKGDNVTSDAAGTIEFKNVHFAYPARPDHQIYKGMNLVIEGGDTVALVGPSGCGKSSAVQLIERFYDPSEGAVFLDGQDIKSLSVHSLRQQIGLVSQEPILFAGSIQDNIRMGKKGCTDDDVVAAAKMSNAHDFISTFPDGYKTECGAGSSQLSGGQKQRIAIARAIIRDPSVLILDEATSALDATSERIVQEALDQLLAKKKRTTIIIAHRLSTIRNANKIVVLDGGTVVEVGTHDSLMAIEGGTYKQLVKNSFGRESNQH